VARSALLRVLVGVGVGVFAAVSIAVWVFLLPQSAPPAAVESDPVSTGQWLDKANAYAASGDYAQAIAIWESLIIATPDDPVPYGNLGRLYYLSLHDYPKAESYFKEELARAPKERIGYLDLYELYTYAYRQDTSAASDILREALVAFPKDQDFLVLLAETYARQGDIARARATYQEALDSIRASGDLERLKAIGEAFAKLPPL
jgi:tetratricopeptide (TPR) repeat protein